MISNGIQTVVAAVVGVVIGVVGILGVVQVRAAGQVSPVDEPLVSYGSR